MSRKLSDEPVGPLNPNSFYRKSVVVRHRLLGYKHSQLDEKIKAGEIDPPVALSESGRAVGWWGHYLLSRQAALKPQQPRPKPTAKASEVA
jgi:hypothetical protein